MKNTLYSILFIFITAGVCEAKPTITQDNQPVLVKGNIGRPTDYMRRVRLAYRRTRKKPLQVERRYSFERKRGEVGRSPELERSPSEAGRLKDFQSVKDVQIKSEIELGTQAQGTLGPVARINDETKSRGGPDPMVAVGEKNVLVGNYDWIKFFDKTSGQVLEEMDVDSLFWRFLSPTVPGTNQPNPDFASNFYNIPKDVPLACSRSQPCKPHDCDNNDYDDDDLPCGETDATIEDAGLIREAYDLKVLYQKEHRRFVVVAALRPQTAKDNNCYNRDGSDADCSQYLIRLVAMAISVSENPADGFHVYRTTENNYRDWPNAVVDQDYLVIAHKSGSAESIGRSIVTVFSFKQMKDGLAGSSVKGFRIRQRDDTPLAVTPVANVLTDTNSQAFFFIENLGDGKIKIWYIKKPTDPAAIFQNPPTRLTEAGQISIDGAGFGGGAFAGATFYSNMLYMVSYQQFHEATSTKRPGYGMNVFQIPVIKKTNGDYQASKSVSEGFQHSVFEHADYSYMDSSIAVDFLKNIVIQFVRLPRSLSSSEKPQIRYKVKFSHQPDWKDSRLSKQWGDSTAGNERLVHFSWVAKDPFKLQHYWHAHIFKSASDEGTWVGRVNLGIF